MMKHLIITLVFVMTLNSPVAAQVSTKGLAALEAYDYATALEELLPLAEQGDARAQSFLGGMYALGTGVLQDYAEAVKWYRLAAEQGNVSAQVSLAFAFHSGAGVLQDNVIAHMWYNIGTANGNESSRTLRDDIAKKMALEDISKAQAMARKCISSDYKECGY